MDHRVAHRGSNTVFKMPFSNSGTNMKMAHTLSTSKVEPDREDLVQLLELGQSEGHGLHPESHGGGGVEEKVQSDHHLACSRHHGCGGISGLRLFVDPFLENLRPSADPSTWKLRLEERSNSKAVARAKFSSGAAPA